MSSVPQLQGDAIVEAPAQAKEPLLPTVLRVLVHGVTGFVACWPLTVIEGVFAGAAGAAVGAVVGRVLSGTKLRALAVVGGCIVAFPLVFGLHDQLIGSARVASALGPAAAVRVGEALLFGLGGLVFSTLLRFLSARRRVLAALELAYVVFAFAGLVIAHRNGAINRPFEIADPLLAQGWDPTLVMVILGALAMVVATVLLLSESSVVRSVVAGGVLLLVLLVVTAVTVLMGLPTPDVENEGLGLRGASGREEGEAPPEEGNQPNDGLEFRDNYDNEQNRVPVGVVLFHSDYSPPSGVYYFRQGAFSQYNGRRLVAAIRGDVDDDIAAFFPSRPMRVDRESYEPFFRVKVEATVGLLTDHNRPFGLESPLELIPADNPDSRRFRRIYDVTSAATQIPYPSLASFPVGRSDWSEDVLAHYTEAPTDPRYRERAERVVAEELPEDLRDLPVARALAVLSYLNQNGTYSLQSRHASADDPTAHFLFGDLTGYCVHFAHAATYLMRTLGLPARVATGYAVEESARQGGSALLISGQTAHAWPELYIDAVGWVPFDVAPERALSSGPAPPDPDLQRLLGELMRGQRPLPVDGRKPPDVEEIAEGTLRYGLAGGGGLVGFVLLLLLTIKVGRRVAPRFSVGRALWRIGYRAELDRLSDLNLRRRYGETREAFARRVGAVAPSFEELTVAHLRARFHAGGIEEAGYARASETLRRELRAAFPWWRRLLGAIVPWTWLQTR
ncbi:MAG: transglutaminase domain-containing protein [Myxococcota bacterium]